MIAKQCLNQEDIQNDPAIQLSRANKTTSRIPTTYHEDINDHAPWEKEYEDNE